MLKYQDRLCVPDVDDLWENMVEEAHGLRYSINPGSTKIYHDLKPIYWLNDMKKDIVDYVAKYTNYLHVKAEHLKLGGLTQIFEVTT